MSRVSVADSRHVGVISESLQNYYKKARVANSGLYFAICRPNSASFRKSVIRLSRGGRILPHWSPYDGDGLGKLRGWPMLPRRACPGTCRPRLHGGHANSSYTTGSAVSTSCRIGGRGVGIESFRRRQPAVTIPNIASRGCREPGHPRGCLPPAVIPSSAAAGRPPPCVTYPLTLLHMPCAGSRSGHRDLGPVACAAGASSVSLIRISSLS